MLPPGHIAAGYLTGYALLKFANPEISPNDIQALLWWSMFFGFAPDLDIFYAFFRQKNLLATESHRKFISHAPFLWLIPGLLVYFFSPTVYAQYIGLLVWLGAWSHFILDSLHYGIMWLWPFSNKVYALSSPGQNPILGAQSFFGYYWEFLKLYFKQFGFYLEIILVIIAAIVFYQVTF